MDPIREAIRTRLMATPAVTSLLGQVNGIYHRIAPRNATPPYIVFHRQTGTDSWTFAGQPLERDLWTVKAISRGASDAAEDIAKQVNLALNDAPIAVAGYALLNLRRESKIDLGEVDAGEMWHTSGALYRVDIDPA